MDGQVWEKKSELDAEKETEISSRRSPAMSPPPGMEEARRRVAFMEAMSAAGKQGLARDRGERMTDMVSETRFRTFRRALRGDPVKIILLKEIFQVGSPDVRALPRRSRPKTWRWVSEVRSEFLRSLVTICAA